MSNAHDSTLPLSECQWKITRLHTGEKYRWDDDSYRNSILGYLIVQIVEEVNGIALEDFQIRGSVYTGQTLNVWITSRQPTLKCIKFVEGLFRDRVIGFLCTYSYAGSFDWVTNDVHFQRAYQVVILSKAMELARRVNSLASDARHLLSRCVPVERVDRDHLFHALATGLGIRQPPTANLHHIFGSDSSISNAERKALESPSAAVKLVRVRLRDGDISAKFPRENLASFLKLLEDYSKNNGFTYASDETIVEFLTKGFPDFEGLLRAAYIFKTLDAALQRMKSEKGHQAIAEAILGTASFAISRGITMMTQVPLIGVVAGLAGYGPAACIVVSLTLGLYKYTISLGAWLDWRNLRSLIITLEKALIVVIRLTNACGTVLGSASETVPGAPSTGGDKAEVQKIADVTLQELTKLGKTLDRIFQTPGSSSKK